MSEDPNVKELDIVNKNPEVRHNSAIDRMMKKVDDHLGEYLAKRDMNPSLWAQDIANTAGFLAIIYGVHALTNETAQNPAFHKILSAISGKPDIVVAADLTSRVMDINSKVNTAADTHNLVDNFYLAKAYVGDFLSRMNIKNTKQP